MAIFRPEPTNVSTYAWLPDSPGDAPIQENNEDGLGKCFCLLLLPSEAYTLLPARELWAHGGKIGCCRCNSRKED
ncbi:hypothetical protein DSO57_1000267 [Entomophthora muscae]|uniref:Uncharacterized protein n=1 Tax=Entomophthora muscae TaxID=34485 RepID=A0ACC2SYU6_9FUNG|nr:hypothetical protein DSO57_1000267 [Entomophthora muscae]